MTKKMTAVEWLEDEINKVLLHLPIERDEVKILIQQAKAMEKEQIEKAFNLGYDQWTMKTSEQYYKETYEKTN